MHIYQNTNITFEYNESQILNMTKDETLLKDEFGATILHYCASKNFVDAIKHLATTNCDLFHIQDFQGNTALYEAAYHNNYDAIHQLLKHGATVHTKNKYGNTALHEAALYKDCKSSELLVKYGASISESNNDGDAPIHFAAKLNSYIETNCYRMSKDIVDLKNSKNKTPLMIAAENDNKESVAKILLMGANVNAADDMKNTSLHLNAINNNKSIASLLLMHGTNINAINARNVHGRTALILAAVNGCDLLVKFLIDSGADTKIKDCCSKDFSYYMES